MGIKIIRLLCLIVASSFTASCAQRVVSSQPLDKDAGDPSYGESGGLLYSLPKTVVTISGTQDATKGTVTYSITPSIMPDSHARFRLRYTASSFSDDDLALQVDSNGLLTSTRGDVTDRTGDIVAVLAKTAAAVALPAPGGPPGGPPGAGAPSPYPFAVIYDLEELQSAPLPDGAQLVIYPWKPDAANNTGTMVSKGNECSYSVCFRGVVPVKGTIMLGSRRTDFEFVGIDSSYTEGIDLRTAFLVNRKNTVSFSSGLATGQTVNKPSSALAVASLPLTVIKAILQAPAELLSLKVINTTDQANLLTQQKAVLDAETALAAAAAAKDKPAGAVTGTGRGP